MTKFIDLGVSWAAQQVPLTFGGVNWGMPWYYRTANFKKSLYLIEEMQVKDDKMVYFH